MFRAYIAYNLAAIALGLGLGAVVAYTWFVALDNRRLRDAQEVAVRGSRALPAVGIAVGGGNGAGARPGA